MKTRLLIIAGFLIVAFSACEKDRSSDNLSISGKWFQDTNWDENLILREIYDFKSDNTLEITGSVIDKDDDAIKGYVRRTTALINFKGDSLILKDLKVYGVTTHTYKNLDELDYISSYNRQSYKVVYNAAKDTITLQFYCPPNANCIPYPRLTRVK